MPYVHINKFKLLDEDPIPTPLFWKSSMKFYKQDDYILRAQMALEFDENGDPKDFNEHDEFDHYEIVQAHLIGFPLKKCILKVAVKVDGTHFNGPANFAVPTCPPLNDDRGELIPDDELEGKIPDFP